MTGAMKRYPARDGLDEPGGRDVIAECLTQFGDLRVSADSLSSVVPQTSSSSRSLDTTSKGCAAKYCKSSITFARTWSDLPSTDSWHDAGSTSQPPTRKSSMRDTFAVMEASIIRLRPETRGQDFRKIQEILQDLTGILRHRLAMSSHWSQWLVSTHVGAGCAAEAAPITARPVARRARRGAHVARRR